MWTNVPKLKTHNDKDGESFVGNKATHSERTERDTVCVEERQNVVRVNEESLIIQQTRKCSNVTTTGRMNKQGVASQTTSTSFPSKG